MVSRRRAGLGIGLLLAVLLAAGSSLALHLPGVSLLGESSPGTVPTAPGRAQSAPAAAAQGVKVIFIHHSTGENWLADDNGGLGIALRDSGFFVSDTNYGWGPSSIGDNTDIGHWWTWFAGPDRDTYTASLYAEGGQHCVYSRLAMDPGGENEIIMFKSCFPNSDLLGPPTQPPTVGDNPLRGESADSAHMTVGNAKGIYNDILAYFATRQDKLFVAITAPPLVANATDATRAANARAFNNWLVSDWLSGYPHGNVAVFDFYNVLTSNGGDANTNDLGWETGNHHRWWNEGVQHLQTVANDFAAYGSDVWDSHPTAAGGQKASAEFAPLLGVFYRRWKEAEGTPSPTVTESVNTSTPTTTRTPTTTASPSPTDTSLPGEHTIIFQQGVSPDPSYAGAADIILARQAESNANLGGAENLETFFGEVERRRSLLRWDLAGLPPGAVVNSATVELYRHGGDPASPMEIALYRVTRGWTEGTGSDFGPGSEYVPDGATWLTATTGVAWATAGGDFDSSTDYGHGANGVLDRVVLPAGMGEGWVSLDATAIVRAWVELGTPNYGLLLRAESGEYTYHYYRSKEHESEGFRPRLVVTYSLGGEATLTPTATSRPPLTPDPGESPTSGPWVRLPLIMKQHLSRLWPTATRPVVVNLDVPLVITNTLDIPRADEPVTSGIPIPRSIGLTDLSVLRLLDGSDQAIPAQFTPLARWGGAPDDASKPVRWLLLDFFADVPANGAATYRLVDRGGPEPPYAVLDVTEGQDAVIVETGSARFSLSKTDGTLDAPHLSEPVMGRATTPGGTVYTTTRPITVTLALSGPVRVSVHVQGAYRDAAGTPLLDYTSRYWFYAGRSEVRLFHTVENNNLCPLGEGDQLQCHDIGSGGSVDVSDISLVIPFELSDPLSYQAGGEDTPVGGSLTDDLVLYQDSSGTDHWDHFPTMTDWHGEPLDTRPRMQSYVAFPGYRTTLGGAVVDSGDQAPGWAVVTGSNGGWAAGVAGFWENFPKALRASPSGMLEVGLFPDEFGPAGYGFGLRAGEHKTHEIVLSCSGTPPLPPMFARASPAWYVGSGAFPFISERDYEDWPQHEDYLNHQLDTAPAYEEWMDWFPNLPEAIEGTDHYGVFDFGDLPIDYEGYHVSPINVKYHVDYGMWTQWARGDDRRWFDLAEAAGRHVADMDILHNVHSPRHWGDGIMFGHSQHDEPGFTNPHRNANSGHPDTVFGVPGLLLTYYLTGYEKAHEAALELADCIEWRLRNDSHLCEYFSPGECSGMGYALGDGMYDGGCRPAANSLRIAVGAYRATGDPRYLEVADALVEWASAEVQPYIGGPTSGSQAMRPWMLNMYLYALAEYTEMRGEFGLPDNGARSTFLVYSDWLRTWPWLDVTPADTGPRGAYPYEWWFDGRTGVPGEDNDNGDAAINNWLLLGADVMAYAHRISGDDDYVERATRLFRAGSRDPWCEGCAHTYTATKELANSVAFGHIFLSEWAAQR